MFVINSIVDFKKNNINFEPGLEFNCIQGDSGSNYKIIFNFKQCINTDKISGILNFILPDKTTQYTDSITFKDKRTAFYQLKNELLAQSGDIEVSLTLMDESRFTVYTYFTIHVKERLNENIDIDPQDPTYLLLQSLLIEVKNLETTIENAELIRVENEQLRIQGETLREQAEFLREEAEKIRIENENQRNEEWNTLKQEIIDKLNTIENGKDAKINGFNTIEIKAGDNIELTQDENIFTINSKSLTWKNF